MKPSDISNEYPWSSVTRNSECETIAQNIIVILKRTGDTWRRLDYEEYKQERMKDGNYHEMERAIFDKVIGYTVSPDTARRFSSRWDILHSENEKCQRCGKNDAQEQHTCPYKQELSDDTETLCNCCGDCRYDCAQSI